MCPRGRPDDRGHPARGARARHLAVGIEHRGRPAGRARPAHRDGLLVLPGHPDPGRGHRVLAGQEPGHAAGERDRCGPGHRLAGRLHRRRARDPLDAGLRGTPRLSRLRSLSDRRGALDPARLPVREGAAEATASGLDLAIHRRASSPASIDDATWPTVLGRSMPPAGPSDGDTRRGSWIRHRAWFAVQRASDDAPSALCSSSASP